MRVDICCTATTSTHYGQQTLSSIVRNSWTCVRVSHFTKARGRQTVKNSQHCVNKIETDLYAEKKPANCLGWQPRATETFDILLIKPQLQDSFQTSTPLAFDKRTPPKPHLFTKRTFALWFQWVNSSERPWVKAAGYQCNHPMLSKQLTVKGKWSDTCTSIQLIFTCKHGHKTPKVDIFTCTEYNSHLGCALHIMPVCSYPKSCADTFLYISLDDNKWYW